MLIDDVDHLDDTSLAVLMPLTINRTVFPIATIRAGRPIPSTVRTLLKDGHLARLELGTLDRDEVATLLHRVLDGPLDAVSLRRLESLSGGNVQLLHELIRSAFAQGALVRDGAGWVLHATETSAALEDLVMSRVGDVSSEALTALELVALTGRIGLSDVEAFSSPAVLEQLENDGLIVIVTDGRRVEVTLSHPLYGEVLRDRIPLLRERAMKRALADRLEGHGARRREDALRLAMWRLDAGGEISSELALSAARLALAARDARLAARFAEVATREGDPGEAARVAVEAHLLLGEPKAAEKAVRSVWDREDLTDRQRAHLGRRLADIRFAAYSDLDGALAAGADALRRVNHPAAIASLEAHQASLLANAARPLDALAAIKTVETVDDARVRVELATATSLALVTLGRAEEAISVARMGRAAQADLPEWLSNRGAAAHLVNEAHAMAYSGRYREAAELMHPSLERAVRSGARSATVWFEMVLAEIARDTGRGTEAVRRFRSVAAAAESAGQRAALVWAHVGIAQGHLLLGEVDEAAVALRDADALGNSPVGTSYTTRERCRAWLTAARGDMTKAREMLLAVAEPVRRDGVYVFEVAVLHDVVRFGDPGAVVDRLRELAEFVDGEIAQTKAMHAEAARQGNPAMLLEVLDSFERMDCASLAAEVAAELAECHRRAGNSRLAAAVGQRMLSLIDRAGGCRTPPLMRGMAAEPLTQREREVALMAAQGMASKEIAARLYLSKRTVETHLDRIYRKLGVAGRDELAGALGGDRT
jgi:DNA-binding CsgD family transcriptional regulator